MTTQTILTLIGKILPVWEGKGKEVEKSGKLGERSLKLH
jgi:hypothetical protein